MIFSGTLNVLSLGLSTFRVFGGAAAADVVFVSSSEPSGTFASAYIAGHSIGDHGIHSLMESRLMQTEMHWAEITQHGPL